MTEGLDITGSSTCVQLPPIRLTTSSGSLLTLKSEPFMNVKAEATTTQQTFYTYEDLPLFAVNAGVPIDDALEVAAQLLLYIERLAAVDAFPDKSVEAAIIQHLSEMARALNLACQAERRGSGG